MNKEQFFEQVAKVYFINREEAKRLKLKGNVKKMTMTNERAMGILDVVDALGFDVVDFWSYYNKRKEQIEGEMTEVVAEVEIKEVTVRLMKRMGDYGIWESKSMDEHWGYTREGAMKTFINIISSYEGE